MSIHIHKTGLNKTLGQQSDEIFSTDLIGNFDPTQGVIATTSWTNQAASNALRPFNGITHITNPIPKVWEFDGVDDYLGEASSGYGGTPFQVAFQNAYTIGQWVYLPSSWGSGKTHILFYFYEDSSNYVMFQIENNVMEIHSYTSSGNLANSAFTSPNLATNKSKWLYHTISHNGSGRYTYHINGMFMSELSAHAPTATQKPMTVGRYGSSYTSADVKVGHIHVYSSEITSSQIRQNFLEIYDNSEFRLYGESVLA